MARKIFLECCQITSVKGIPRLLRTKSVFMRFIWTISVIGFLCLALFHAILLTIEYFQYKYFTNTGELYLDLFNMTNGFSGIPDITLCNANPFASNRSLSKEIPTMEEYFKLVEQSTTCDNGCTEEEKASLNDIMDDMMSTNGYFNYIGRHNAAKLGHTLESFIAYCELDKVGINVFRRSIPCLPTAQILQIQHTMFYNCYTIRLPRNEFSGSVFGGFRVVLHLDDYDAMHNEDSLLAPHDEAGQMSGVWIFPHQQNTPFNTYNDRMLLQPGHFHDIHVKMELRTFLPPPHGECQNMDGQEYSWTKCYTTCLQTHIYEQCGCTYLLNYTSQWDAIENKGPHCFSLPLDKNSVIKNLKCIKEVQMERFQVCATSCPWSCNEMRYNLKVG